MSTCVIKSTNIKLRNINTVHKIVKKNIKKEKPSFCGSTK